jgi:hypothetical protein
LMAYIPDQSVARRIENVVQRHGQFDNAEAGSEVTSGRRNSADRFGPQFVCDLPELTLAQVPQIGRRFDGVEKWCRHGHHHNMIVLAVDDGAQDE